MRVTMWEARAAAGADLVGWVRGHAPDGAQLYASVDRVVVIAPAPVDLQPPAALVARPPHAWDFDRLDHGEP